MIDKLEKELRTNMFEEEWRILTTEIQYEPNTKTESKIVQRFRIFIFAILIVEIVFLFIKLNEAYPFSICICNH